MSMRAVAIGGFVVLAVVTLILFVAGRARRFGLAPLGDVTDTLRSTGLGRFTLLAAWAWIGWHLLAR